MNTKDYLKFCKSIPNQSKKQKIHTLYLIEKCDSKFDFQDALKKIHQKYYQNIQGRVINYD